ncbi:MAG TPA: hypothetical protein VK986_11465, partial [Tepidisphaeraceae bacterium]|nr:hypothetical protein [Tepidisphaeraceae bacterium]
RECCCHGAVDREPAKPMGGSAPNAGPGNDGRPVGNVEPASDTADLHRHVRRAKRQVPTDTRGAHRA